MTIKASHDRIAARYPHVLFALGDSPVQPLTCEVCDEPTTADSWIEGLRLLICPLCLEMQIEAQSMEPKTL